jgi:hypothetical protein
LGTEFKITYKDSLFNTLPGATIQIQRKYTGEGLYRVVEIPKIGATGFAIAHLIKNDATYNLIVLNNGTVLDTFNGIVPFCQNPTFEECTININSASSSLRTEDYTIQGDFSSSLSWNKTARTITAIFTIPSGSSVTTILNATLYDGLGNRSVCSDSLNSAGGTLSCIVPTGFMNSTVLIKLYSNGLLKRTAIINLAQDPTDLYGGGLLFLGIIFMLSLIGMGISEDPRTLGIFLIGGTILMGAINLIAVRSWIGTGATLLWLIVAIIMIFIKRGNKS